MTKNWDKGRLGNKTVLLLTESKQMALSTIKDWTETQEDIEGWGGVANSVQVWILIGECIPHEGKQDADIQSEMANNGRDECLREEWLNTKQWQYYYQCVTYGVWDRKRHMKTQRDWNKQ